MTSWGARIGFTALPWDVSTKPLGNPVGMAVGWIRVGEDHRRGGPCVPPGRSYMMSSRSLFAIAVPLVCCASLALPAMELSAEMPPGMPRFAGPCGVQELLGAPAVPDRWEYFVPDGDPLATGPLGVHRDMLGSYEFWLNQPLRRVAAVRSRRTMGPLMDPHGLESDMGPLIDPHN